MNAAATTGVLTIVPLLWCCRRRFRGTTLTTAWAWAIAAAAFWTVTSLCTGPLKLTSANIADQLWYGTAVLTLAPAVAVLGAQRPGVRVWNWFVILPMIAVLGWPALTVWGAEQPPQALRVETPMGAGFALILLMGIGNYLGTRFAGSALLMAAAICLIVVPLSAAGGAVSSRETARTWASFAATAAVWWAASRALYCPRRDPTLLPPLYPARQNVPFMTANGLHLPLNRPHPPHDRVWRAFSQMFGIVWAKRILDRVNRTAEKERWSARLQPEGFVWVDEATDEDRRRTISRIEAALRWLLRRFVDPEWFDAHWPPGKREM